MSLKDDIEELIIKTKKDKAERDKAERAKKELEESNAVQLVIKGLSNRVFNALQMDEKFIVLWFADRTMGPTPESCTGIPLRILRYLQTEGLASRVKVVKDDEDLYQLIFSLE